MELIKILTSDDQTYCLSRIPFPFRMFFFKETSHILFFFFSIASKTKNFLVCFIVVILRATNIGVILVFDDYKDLQIIYVISKQLSCYETLNANYRAHFILTYGFVFALNPTLFLHVIVIIDACICIENRNRNRYTPLFLRNESIA